MDTRWYTFADICRRDFEACEFKQALIAECGGNEDIAWSTFFHLRGDSLAWLHRSVPSLDGREPVELIAEGQGDRVRDCLWSMPC